MLLRIEISHALRGESTFVKRSCVPNMQYRVRNIIIIINRKIETEKSSYHLPLLNLFIIKGITLSYEEISGMSLTLLPPICLSLPQ